MLNYIPDMSGRKLRSRRYGPIAIALVAAFWLGGCTSPMPPSVTSAEPEGKCLNLFRHVESVVRSSGVRDGGDFPVDNLPYLRTSRFYASFRDRVEGDAAFATWIGRMAGLDRQARAIEIANLPAPERRQLGDDILKRLDGCRQQLVRTQFAQPQQRQALIDTVEVPDDYATLNRFAGLYPVTALFVSSGVRRWHEEERATYATPLEKLPVAGRLTRWSSHKGSSLSRQQVEAILNRSVDPLGTPVPSAKELNRLFDSFAPVWEVDVVDGNDRIGSPAWNGGVLSVNTSRPALFRKLSYTRYRGKILLQLNYIVWFAARDSDDIYGGEFDGINWRVTLDRDGTPLLFDSIHNCGCYQKFYPGKKIRLRRDLPTSYYETPMAPQAAPERAPDGNPVVLRISHTNHFIQRVYRDGHPSALPLAVRDYDELRSLPQGSGHRSMFDEDGIVQQSARPERFLLWPTGVRSPGAMRQWGRHNTAFVGKRHFDDPDLIESLFEEAAP